MSDVTVAPPGERLKVLEEKVARGLETFIEVGNALAEIKADRLFETVGFTSFESYCSQRWAMSRQRGYQLVAAARTHQLIAESYPQSQSVNNVDTFTAGPPKNDRSEPLDWESGFPPKVIHSPDSSAVLPVSEAQIRPLGRLDDSAKIEAWGLAVEAAGGQPTAAQVEAAADWMIDPEYVGWKTPERLHGESDQEWQNRLADEHFATAPKMSLEELNELAEARRTIDEAKAAYFSGNYNAGSREGLAEAREVLDAHGRRSEFHRRTLRAVEAFSVLIPYLAGFGDDDVARWREVVDSMAVDVDVSRSQIEEAGHILAAISTVWGDERGR